jgi:hypothetical protein
MISWTEGLRKRAPHWSQMPGDTHSAWKQQNAREILYVGSTSSQTRSVHHPRHWRKCWHSCSEKLDHLRISSLTASNSADSVTSDSRALTPRNPSENFCFLGGEPTCVSPRGLTIPVHNVALECGFELSKISASSDEVIGYKSPVIRSSVLASFLALRLCQTDASSSPPTKKRT